MESNGTKSALKRSVIAALRRALYLLCVVGGWLLLSRAEFIHPRYLDTGTVVVGALLFLLGLPTSIIIRLDKLSENLPIESYPMMLLLGVVIVAINWVLIAVARTLISRGRHQNSE